MTLAEGREDDALAELDGVDGTLAAYQGARVLSQGSPKAAALLGQVVDAWSGCGSHDTGARGSRTGRTGAADSTLLEVERAVEVKSQVTR